MLVRMLVRSSRRPWHRHLDKSSLAFGVFMVLFGFFEYHTGRENERMHRVHYVRGAPVTPTQDYLAAFGFIELTAGRRTTQLHMSSTRQSATTRPLARGSSACFR